MNYIPGITIPGLLGYNVNCSAVSGMVISAVLHKSCNAANVWGLVSRKKLTDDKAQKALSLLKGVLDYSEFKDVDMVIEVWAQTCLFFFLEVDLNFLL